MNPEQAAELAELRPHLEPLGLWVFDPRTVDLDAFEQAVRAKKFRWVPNARWGKPLNGRQHYTDEYVEWASQQVCGVLKRPVGPYGVVNFTTKLMNKRFKERNAPTRDALVDRFLGPFPGWDISSKQSTWSEGDVEIKLVNAEHEVDLLIHVSPRGMPYSSFDNGRATWGGDTNFQTTKGSRTFTRRGVDDSFHGNDTDLGDVSEFLESQIKRSLEARARIDNMLRVPGTNWLTTPERRQKDTKTLASGGRVVFRPSGFGIGNVFSVSRTHEYARLANQATADFYNQTTLWVEDMDCD